MKGIINSQHPPSTVISILLVLIDFCMRSPPHLLMVITIFYGKIKHIEILKFLTIQFFQIYSRPFTLEKILPQMGSVYMLNLEIGNLPDIETK